MSRTQSRSETTLVEQARKGNKAAYGALVEPHISRLIALASRMLASSHEAEDAVQEGLASVWVARDRLDPARSVGPFLTTVILNKCRDRLRKRKAARFFGFDTDSEILAIADDSPDPEEIATQRQELRKLTAEIERLPIRLREALVLVSIEERSQAEAAELLGVSEKAIETRIYRARQKLRDRLENF